MASKINPLEQSMDFVPTFAIYRYETDQLPHWVDFATIEEAVKTAHMFHVYPIVIRRSTRTGPRGMIVHTEKAVS